MKNKTLTLLRKSINKKYGKITGKKITTDAIIYFNKLCSENPDEPDAVKVHTEGRIYPAIAFYKSIQKNNISKNEAYQFIYDYFIGEAQKQANLYRTLFKIPGLYNIMPTMWKIVTKKTFGEAAGFRFHFYETGKDRVKFDMLKCPYCENFKKYDCFELTKIFCHTDDITSDNLHKNLIWNRTKTIGNGDVLCDFDLYIKK